MDCHNCENLRYDGCPYGRCIHRGHPDVRFYRNGRDGNKRPYNKQICPDFVLKKRCSNCAYWIRGEYFADGKTPAKKGKCSLRCGKNGSDCPIWKRGRTSWKKKSRDDK